jgi:hypothetical protein
MLVINVGISLNNLEIELISWSWDWCGRLRDYYCYLW